MKVAKALVAAAMVSGIAGTAHAADLGRPAPAAVDYVKVCDAYGAGFFYLPGTDTCLKIGGFVRYDIRTGNAGSYAPGRSFAYNGINQSDRTKNSFYSRTRADLAFDVRTNTEFGLLRSYVDIWNQMYSTNGNTLETIMRSAYVQFGGLTAGRATSFFDFWEGSTQIGAIEPDSSDHRVNLIGYTAAFGNGVTASIAIEDQSTTDFGVPTYATVDSNGAPYYGGLKHPDIVGNILVTQAWGRAQIMAAAHENYSAVNGASKWGFAVGGGVEVNLPALAAGDKAFVQTIYAQGANGYGLVNGLPSAGSFVTRDFWINGTGGLSQSTTWVVTAGVKHNISATWETNFGGSYAKVDQYNNGNLAGGDFSQLILGGDLIWKPRPNFNIGLALDYRNIAFTGPTKAAFNVHGTDNWIGTLRVLRMF